MKQALTFPIRDPGFSLGFAQLFPEVAAFRSLVRVLIADAFVKFADGQPGSAIDSLLTALNMGYRIRSLSWLHWATAMLYQDAVFAELDLRLGSLPPGDLERIRVYADTLLATGRAAFAEMARVQERRHRYQISEAIYLTDPEIRADFMRGDPDPDVPTPEGEEEELTFTKLDRKPESFKRQLQLLIESESDAIFNRLRELVSSSERNWFAKAEDEEEEEKTEEGELFRYAAIVRGYELIDEGYLHQLAIRHTQLRLLRAHCCILRHRWNTGRLPERLSDAMPHSYAADDSAPLGFVYVREGNQRYQLYSSGLPSTGRIDLLYKFGQ